LSLNVRPHKDIAIYQEQGELWVNAALGGGVSTFSKIIWIDHLKMYNLLLRLLIIGLTLIESFCRRQKMKMKSQILAMIVIF
jgi:hypothetical protein